MALLICAAIIFTITTASVWAWCRGGHVAEAVGVGIMFPAGGFLVLGLFFGVGGPLLSTMNSPEIEHTKVQNITKAVYLPSSDEYLVDVDLGNGLTETVRLGDDDNYIFKAGDRNQLVHRQYVFNDGKVLWWDWSREESTVLLLEPKVLEVKEGM